MAQTNLAVDALGVLTICLVVLLIFMGLFCIIHTLYFHIHLQRSGFARLGYFKGPWIVRIAFIAFGICWGAGEVVRLSFFRQEGRFFRSVDRKWQENMCKFYILSNLGFTEPCLFLTISFLLHASLNWRGTGTLNHRWSIKTTGYILLYCLPVFVLDFLFVMVAPKLRHSKINTQRRLLEKLTSTYLPLIISGHHVIACTYPILCILLHGLFAIVLIPYVVMLGRRMLGSVINQGMRRKVYLLISLVSSCLPLRDLFLGFSVLAWQEHLVFEVLSFIGFFVLLSCIVVAAFLLVYLPVTDCLAISRDLGSWGSEVGEGRSSTSVQDYDDSLPLVPTNHSHFHENLRRLPMARLVKNGTSSAGIVDEEEMTAFIPDSRLPSSFG